MRLSRGGCVRPTAVVRFYRNVLCPFAPIIRSCRNVLCSITPAVCRMSAKQDGLRYVPFLFRRVGIAISAFSGCRAVIGHIWFTSALAVSLWRSRRGTGDAEDGERGWRRGACALLRNHIGLVILSAGSTLGLRAPDCAKESSTLWTLFTLRRGYAGAYSRRLCVFAQPHWLSNAFRGEYAGAARPKPAPKSLRLSGLSSRCGGAVLVQIPIPAKNASTQIAAPTLAKPGYTERPARL